MARIITAYIAHGHRSAGGHARKHEFPLDTSYLFQWQRIYCLFSIIRAFSDEDDCPRFILISDHAPPAIDGRMVGFHLERLGVEIHKIDHVWRPYDQIGRIYAADFFLFDVFEHLASLTDTDDDILIFSGKALVVNPLDRIFSDLKMNSVLFAEASYGELAEHHDRALRDRMTELRQHYEIGFPKYAMRAASTDFIGVNHARLKSLIGGLRKLFMKNLLRALQGEDHFVSADEFFAALLAHDKIYHSYLTGLSDHAAAIPDDFSVANLSDIPVIIPGYGREPDIPLLFEMLIGDRLDERDGIDRDTVFKLLRGEESNGPLHKIIRSFLWFRR